MIAVHRCVHDRFKGFYKQDEQMITKYYNEYPSADDLRDLVDDVHYVVIDLVPDCLPIKDVEK